MMGFTKWNGGAGQFSSRVKPRATVRQNVTGNRAWSVLSFNRAAVTLLGLGQDQWVSLFVGEGDDAGKVGICPVDGPPKDKEADRISMSGKVARIPTTRLGKTLGWQNGDAFGVVVQDEESGAFPPILLIPVEKQTT